ncbi:hypothetical protein [Nocardia alni]|uniref:hypothetical protein n=1 Tax=Nocardia alni TaxID=2815723 RepID=UPI001C2448E6|nr:hypothetical protein [Nocardia alni]
MERDGRWRMPLRRSTVVAIGWHEQCLVLSFANGMDVAAGYSSQLSPVFRISGDQDRKPIVEWTRPQVEQGLRSSDVVSSVAFRTGELRIGFRNGWTIRAVATDPVCPARIRVDGQVLWDGSGIHDVAGFEVEKPVLPAAPVAWPDSDDINDIPWPDVHGPAT